MSMDTRVVVLLARTLDDARVIRREMAPYVADLMGARLASTHAARGLYGLRAHRVYVAPDAVTGPYYTRCLAILRRSLLITHGADADVTFLPQAVAR